MDFAIKPETQALLQEIRRFVDERIILVEPAVMRHGFSGAEQEIKALREEVKARGWWTPQVPRSIGGLGLSLVDHGLVSEILGRTPLGHFVFGCQAPDAGNIEILHKFGTESQKAEFLVPLLAGRIRSCFSMTEPEHAGSNPTELSCVARDDGDHYVIEGPQWFTSSADGSSLPSHGGTDPLPPDQRAV